MTEEENLRRQLGEIQSELKAKNEEISKYLDKIDHLEEEIISLHELEPEKDSKKKSKKVKESKLHFELQSKDREIRDLKDSMGFLRKEKIEAQRELEKFKLNEMASSSVIRVEDIREKNKAPLNILVKELQEKINKKDSLIKRLKGGNYKTEDFEEKQKEKDELINSLNLEIQDLKQNLKDKGSFVEQKPSEDIKKKLMEELQEKLNKAKRQIEDLKLKLSKYSKKGKTKVSNEISELMEELEKKDKEIKSLRSTTSISQSSSETSTLEQVVEELQNKLNKAKTQIVTLQEQLDQPQDSHLEDPSQKDIDGKLKIQREMAIFLQQQLDESNRALRTKEEELGTIKNEAIRIKNKYEDVFNQLKTKDQMINELKTELDRIKFDIQTQSQPIQSEDTSISLRIKELKSIIEDLNKQNIQQRLEISQLRKSN